MNNCQHPKRGPCCNKYPTPKSRGTLTFETYRTPEQMGNPYVLRSIANPITATFLQVGCWASKENLDTGPGVDEEDFQGNQLRTASRFRPEVPRPRPHHLCGQVAEGFMTQACIAGPLKRFPQSETSGASATEVPLSQVHERLEKSLQELETRQQASVTSKPAGSTSAGEDAKQAGFRV